MKHIAVSLSLPLQNEIKTPGNELSPKTTVAVNTLSWEEISETIIAIELAWRDKRAMHSGQQYSKVSNKRTLQYDIQKFT